MKPFFGKGEKMKKIIDISRYQAPDLINYDKLSKQIDGVILRIGVTGYGTGESLNKDTAFDKHYAEFKKRGVPIGGYYYSCANEIGEGKREAEFVYNIIKGKTFELPIYWDSEDQYHQKKMTKAQLSKVGKEFLDFLEDKGYYVGIYASASWFKNELDMNMLANYDVWVAHYGVDKPSYERYGMWQYTDSGKLDGYNGNLDMNYMYKDYPKIIKGAGLNGFKKQTATDQVKPEKNYNGFRKQNGSVVYFRESGTQAYKWQFIRGNWYYFRPNTGTMVTGFQYIDKTWRYFDNLGRYFGDATIKNKKDYRD